MKDELGIFQKTVKTPGRNPIMFMPYTLGLISKKYSLPMLIIALRGKPCEMIDLKML